MPLEGLVFTVSTLQSGRSMLFAAAILTLTPGMFFSGVFTDHVVLQRAPARAAVYGGGCSSGTVSVTVTKGIVLVETVNASAASRAGEWKALLTAQPAGGAFTIKATCGDASASLHDVTFGDVWLCTGQSNMELNMGFTFEQNETYVNISKGALATIRIFHLDHFASPYDAPIDVFNNTDLNLANWTTLDSASLSTLTLGKDVNVVNTFSAACLYFATSLTYRMQQQQAEAGGGAVVPLGMIESAWGGTAIEQWLSPAAQLTCGNVTCLANHSVPYSAATAEMCANDDNGGKQAELGNGGLWNGMTRPFVNMTVKGYLWYQGENNLFADAGTTANGGSGYACLLQKQMESWRSAWSVTPGTTSSTAPFGIVQLADGTDEGWGCNTLQMHWGEKRFLLRCDDPPVALLTYTVSHTLLLPPLSLSLSRTLQRRREIMVSSPTLRFPTPLSRRRTIWASHGMMGVRQALHIAASRQ